VIVFVAATMMVCVTLTQALAEELTVLRSADGEPVPAVMLETLLKQQAYAAIDRRTTALEKLKSRAECSAWQAERRRFFLKQLGGFPVRTPLNPKVVGTLDGDGYRVEKILFESRLRFHVAANLYLPKSQGPWPGVIVPCGHSHDGKAAGGYQRICILLARHGMAAMCYDPIGQGERYQMLDVTRERTHFEDAPHVPVPHPNVRCLCTDEHTMMGLGCILLGSNVAQYRIWDGMRAIDYLQSRDDILRDKIGCTGNSGGGTLTSYLMALDDRIVAAAPVCYLTTFRRLIETSGPQDAEQNIFGQLAFGMDEADYVMMRAPRPTLICAGTRDSTFDIRGTWDLFRESKRFYSRLGHAERVELHEADAPHGFTIQQREAAARWLHRWLLGSDKPIREVEALPDPLSDEQSRDLSKGDWTAQQLQCTPRGQVLLTPGERSVFEINAEIAAELKSARVTAWQKLSANEKRRLVRETISRPVAPRQESRTATDSTTRADRSENTKVSGALGNRVAERAGYVELGRIERDGYTIHKLALTVEPGLNLPALAFLPAKPTGAATLYLHGSSMKADASPGGPIESLVKQGQIVLAAELRGIGETETGQTKKVWGRVHFGPDIQEVLLAYLLGQSYVGLRVTDIEAWTHVLQTFPDAASKPRELNLVAMGEATIPALHAAALNPDTFKSITLRNMLASWEDLVSATESRDQAVNVVHGALRRYDLPDLFELLGESKVRVFDAVGPLGPSTGPRH
jgi:dienelactone hydrolase